MIEIRPATLRDVQSIAPYLRSADIQELFAATGLGPTTALISAVAESSDCWIMLSDSSPIALFGMETHPQNPTVGIPWMVATDGLFAHRRYLLKNAKHWLNRLAAPYKRLVNYVDARNERHIEWLKWAGFKFTDLTDFGPFRKPFYRFEMEITPPCAPLPQS